MIRWAAGLFEGEGWVNIRKVGRGLPFLALSSTDLDVLKKFHRVMGGYLLGPYQPKKRKVHKRTPKKYWSWHSAAGDLRPVKRLISYLGKRRRTRLEEVFDL